MDKNKEWIHQDEEGGETVGLSNAVVYNWHKLRMGQANSWAGSAVFHHINKHGAIHITAQVGLEDGGHKSMKIFLGPDESAKLLEWAESIVAERKIGRRERRIHDAKIGKVEAPFIIASNIGYEDWPSYRNPFDPTVHPSADNGYRSGFNMRQSQEDGTWDSPFDAEQNYWRSLPSFDEDGAVDGLKWEGENRDD